MLGLIDGETEGLTLGDTDADGLSDGLTLLETEGDTLGDTDGLTEGDTLADGETLGLTLGDTLGLMLGDTDVDGLRLGNTEGEALGLTDGLIDGLTEELGLIDAEPAPPAGRTPNVQAAHSSVGSIVYNPGSTHVALTSSVQIAPLLADATASDTRLLSARG